MSPGDSTSSLRNVLANYYLPYRVLDRRWWIIGPSVILLVAYLVSSMTTLARQTESPSPTIWEMMINVLTNRLIIHHGLTNLFIYKISNLGTLENLDMQLLLRIRSRRNWLKALETCLLSVVALYISLIVVSTLVAALPFAQFSHEWSGYFQAYRERFWLPQATTIWLQPSPVLTVAMMAILMSLAWLFMALSTLLATILTQRALFGFLTALFLNYSALFAVSSKIAWLRDLWLARYMFLWNESVIANSIPLHFLTACLYWLTLNGIALIALWHVVVKVDFTAHQLLDV